VHVVADLPGAVLTVLAEQCLQIFEEVGFSAEVTELGPASVGRFLTGSFHPRPVVAVECVAMDDGGLDSFTFEDLLEGIGDRAGPGTGRTGDRDHWMFS